MKRLYKSYILIPMIFFLLSTALSASAFAAGSSVLSWHPGCDSSVTVDAQTDGSGCMFLPASADYSALLLSAPEDTVLTGDEAGVSVFVPAGETVTVDITPLFGEMLPGCGYDLQLRSPSGRSSLTLMKSANLSSMHVRIDGKLDEVNKSDDKSVSFPGDYAIISPNGSLFSFGTLEQFKGRGNSSWLRSDGKQPYNIKLTESSGLIPGSGNSKRWALVSENVSGHDRTGLSNRVAMQLYRDLGGENALDSENVDLYVNGQYRGTYMLSEKPLFSGGVIDLPDTVYDVEDDGSRTLVIQHNGISKPPKYWGNVMFGGKWVTSVYEDSTTEDPAIASGIQAYQYYNNSVISSQSGYLLEMDFRFYNEGAWFITRRGIPIVVREPEHPGCEEVRRIACRVQRFEDALFSADGFNERGDHYTDLLDIDSQARMYLLDSFICNRDAHRASTFYYAPLDENGEITKLRAGPAWDYNSVDMSAVHFFGNDIGTVSYYTIWMTQLASHGDFLYCLYNLNNELLLPAVDALLDGGLDEYIEELSVSQRMNEVLWRNHFNSGAQSYAEAIKGRSDVWRDRLWTDDKLLGVSLTESDGTLKAQTAGTADELSWYRYDEAAHSLEPIPGVSGTEYTPEEEGIYCVSASGKNIIYNMRSASFVSTYSPNSIPSFTMNESFTAYSNPVDTRLSRKEDSSPAFPEAEAQEAESTASPEEITPAPVPSQPASISADAEAETAPQVRLAVIYICAAAISAITVWAAVSRRNRSRG